MGGVVSDTRLCAICSKQMKSTDLVKVAQNAEGQEVHAYCLRLEWARRRWEDPDATSPNSAGRLR